MSALKWATGETCRPGDVVQWPGCTGRQTCTALGEDQALIRHEASVEYAAVPSDFNLLRRAGENEDRDNQKWEYREGPIPNSEAHALEQDQWEFIGYSDDGAGANKWLVYRRLRQPAPATAPTTDHISESTDIIPPAPAKNTELARLLVATLKLANELANDGIGTAKVNGTPPDKTTLLADDAVWALTFLFHQHGRADLLAEAFGSDDDDPLLKSPTILPAVAAGRCLPPRDGHGGVPRPSSPTTTPK